MRTKNIQKGQYKDKSSLIKFTKKKMKINKDITNLIIKHNSNMNIFKLLELVKILTSSMTLNLKEWMIQWFQMSHNLKTEMSILAVELISKPTLTHNPHIKLTNYNPALDTNHKPKSTLKNTYPHTKPINKNTKTNKEMISTNLMIWNHKGWISLWWVISQKMMMIERLMWMFMVIWIKLVMLLLMRRKRYRWMGMWKRVNGKI